MKIFSAYMHFSLFRLRSLEIFGVVSLEISPSEVVNGTPSQVGVSECGHFEQVPVLLPDQLLVQLLPANSPPTLLQSGFHYLHRIKYDTLSAQCNYPITNILATKLLVFLMLKFKPSFMFSRFTLLNSLYT